MARNIRSVAIMRRITSFWGLQSAPNHYAFHQSTQLYKVVGWKTYGNVIVGVGAYQSSVQNPLLDGCEDAMDRWKQIDGIFELKEEESQKTIIPIT